MHHTSGQHTSQEMQQCIQNCTDCHRICLETVAYCLRMGGKHAEAAHIRLLLDCAEICQTSANFMIRGSDFHGRTCGVCAEVCEACAQDCEQMGDDAQMRACAEMCRRCAESCRHMATMAS
ncbi:MAG TPA: four-helix bundle copper-binding protein [Herpetosiphonaceae bacterium]|nr:four-helix bundle copper-binding protein [Herpetosiphonaceae bacterium]